MTSSKFHFLCIVLILAVFIAPLFSQTPSQLFQQGLLKENGEGDLKAAVAIYEKIVGDETTDRSLRAKAQLHIGICYEKLGLKEAQKAYQKVIDNYPAQNEVVKIAKEKLFILQKAESVIKKATEDLTVRKILADPGMNDHGDRWCSISPDGRYVAFVDNLNLVVRDIVTGKNRNLTTNGSLEAREFAEHAIFSPDGKKIAYDRHNKDETWDLCLIGIDGSENRVLLHRKNKDWIWPVGWSPIGGRILTAFFRKDSLDLTGEIAFVSAKDGSVEVIKPTHKTAFSNISEMSISPDGRYIVYHASAAEGSKQKDLYLLSSDGKRDLPLIQHPANEHSPTWTPDGKRILFVSERNGTPGFWMIDVLDGEPKGSPVLVKSGIGQFDGGIGFTNEGAYYYKLGSKMQDIYVAEIDAETYKVKGDPQILTGLTQGSNMEPAWSPDGQYLAYYRQRGSESYTASALSIVIHSLQSGKERELSNNLIKYGGLQWFPDAHSLLVSALRAPKDFRFDYYRIEIETGETSLILQRENGSGTPWPGLSPDGKTIYFTYFDHGEPSNAFIFSYQIETQQEKELYRIGPGRRERQSIVVSPDGQQLAFVDHEGPWPISSVVKVIPAGGGQVRELFRIPWPGFIPGNRALEWTSDGHRLLLVKFSSDIGELLLIPVEGGESKEIELTEKHLESPGMHPDGKQVVYSARSKSPATEVWVMENFLQE